MTQDKIDRINQLARKQKTLGLSDEEKTEQANLRQEYLADFRKSFGGILENTVVQYPDGTRKKLEEFKDKH